MNIARFPTNALNIDLPLLPKVFYERKVPVNEDAYTIKILQHIYTRKRYPKYTHLQSPEGKLSKLAATDGASKL